MSSTPSEDHIQGWDEESSSTFLELAAAFVPAREEQIATLVSLVPALSDEAFLSLIHI